MYGYVKTLESAAAVRPWLETRPLSNVCKQKHDITHGAGQLGQNGVTLKEANSTGMPPNKAE